MAKPAVSVGGAGEVIGALSKLDKATDDLGKTAGPGVAAVLIPEVSLRSPRRTGALGGSWSAKVGGGIESSVPYAGPIEYGWHARGIPPAGTVRMAIEAKQDEIVKLYEAQIAELGRKAGFRVTG